MSHNFVNEAENMLAIAHNIKMSELHPLSSFLQRELIFDLNSMFQIYCNAIYDLVGLLHEDLGHDEGRTSLEHHLRPDDQHCHQHLRLLALRPQRVPRVGR
jgi:hypothetical protein